MNNSTLKLSKVQQLPHLEVASKMKLLPCLLVNAKCQHIMMNPRAELTTRLQRAEMRGKWRGESTVSKDLIFDQYTRACCKVPTASCLFHPLVFDECLKQDFTYTCRHLSTSKCKYSGSVQRFQVANRFQFWQANT